MSGSESLLPTDDIAIVGMACRFPGATNHHAYWDNLVNGEFAVREVPAERWRVDEYYSPDREAAGHTVSKWGGFITDIDKFDAPLFKISPREAEWMDPQQRIMLELAWACIEDAGYAPSEFRGSDTGVYIGCCNFDYKVLMERSAPVLDAHFSTGAASTLIPNRISYEFDLRGPSIPLDTACSSSLVALDEAVHALRRGDCSAALVGGISILCTPNFFITFSKSGMLSPDGICKSFDERADGYVRGEGAGLVLLKPLRDAERDGDLIYGLVKGVGVNHGGKVSTVTSPNPFAQSQVVVKAFRHAGLSPASVSYIEAHGTGTPMGDPIEVTALSRAFASLAKAEGIVLPERSCAIGTVKTNIGHLEAAAGIAGLIKVLLSMQHATLPGLLHFQRLNPRVKLEGGPFYLVTEPQRWEPGPDGVRRAGVSSFGFGGVNAHALLEEYRAADTHGTALPRVLDAAAIPLLFVLSAKTLDSLNRYALRLVDHLDSAAGEAFSLESLAYSLQRREALDERLAVEARSVGELVARLRACLQDGSADGCWRGNVREGRELTERVGTTDELAALMQGRLAARQAAPIAKLWVQGVAVRDWTPYHAHLPEGRPPRRMRLPAYAFARKRYWFDEGRPYSRTATAPLPVPAPSQATAGSAPAAVLHPLLQHNTSTLAEQRYSSRFDGAEFFLADHRIDGVRVLPGVAYLEMAQAALRRACADGQAEGSRVALKNVVWARQIVVADTPLDVHIGLYPDAAAEADDGHVPFEVYSGGGSAARHAAARGVTVHAQGRGRVLPPAPAPRLDLDALRQKLAAGERSVEACYAAFAAMGVAYGPAQRGIVQIWSGEDSPGRPAALARLVVPEAAARTGLRFALHPSLLDGALQATLAVGWPGGATSAPTQAWVPFALQEAEITTPAMAAEGSPDTLWAWIRSTAQPHGGAAQAGFAERMAAPFDIDLCDGQGVVHVALRGVAFRSVAVAPAQGVLMFKQSWQDSAALAGLPDSAPACAVHRVLLAGFDRLAGREMAPAVARLREMFAANSSSVVGIDDLGVLSGRTAGPTATPAELAAVVQAQAVALLRSAQQAMRDGSAPPGPKLMQLVVPDNAGVHGLFSALGGLLRTACLEHTQWRGQLVAVDAATPPDKLIEQLQQAARNPEEALLRFRSSRCEVARLEEINAAGAGAGATPADSPWKENGVYLITGGAGGLGRLFAREVCSRARRVTLVLAGRAALNAEAVERLATGLRPAGSQALIEYRSVDVSDAGAVAALVCDLRSRHGRLNGVIHAAGQLRDGYLMHKTAHEFEQVMAPKVSGTVALEAATQNADLDFLVLFSSTAGVLGNPGQADYATANAFMDAFARYRHDDPASRRAEGLPQGGRTVSIAWPLWQEGGMAVDAATEQALLQRFGLLPLGTDAGLQAFYGALASGEPQVLVVAGRLAPLRRALSGRRTAPQRSAVSAPAPAPAMAAADAPVNFGEALDRLQRSLIQMAATLLKLEPGDFDPRTELSEYGFDSVAYTGLASRIGDKYGIDVSPTMFFEQPTIAGIANILWRDHRQQVAGAAMAAQPAAAAAVPALALQAGAASDSDSVEADAHALDAVAGPQIASLYRARGTAARAAPPVRGSQRRMEPVAIVGMSGAFPMARDLDAFWRNLDEGRDCIGEIPAQRWDWQALYGDPLTQVNRSNVKQGGFIDGVDEFDPLFFGISRREALVMDPQQRLLMTHVWQCIEDAGYSAAALAGSNTAIIAATGNAGYNTLLAKAGHPIEGYTATATVPSVGPNRMSYLLDLQGPSEPVETACSSSLVALHRAITLIESGECDQAIVGGINTIVTPELHISFNKAGMLAPDGRCKTFSGRANGYGRGEGVGMLFLKRLSAAEAAGDHIHGLIRGSAQNHGGRANSLTSPNPRSQADVIVRAWRKAGVDPRTATYLEAHGTGTALGDPIEINGLRTAFDILYRSVPDSGATPVRCALASVKTNVGHLELAAGVAGVIKVLLQLRHRRIVQSLHCEQINPHIDLGGTPFTIAQSGSAWETARDAQGRPLPRRAGVSSFGFGGVNAHVVLEEYVAPVATPTHPSTGPVMVPLSARTPLALRAYAQRLLDFTERSPELSLHDLAYTLQVGRDARDERLGIVAHGTRDLCEKLRGFLEGRDDLQDVYVGQLARHRELLGAFASDEDLQATLQLWITKGKYGRFLGLWVMGMAFDWATLHTPADRPRRISAPTYPFATDRFWPGMPIAAAASDAASKAAPAPPPAAAAPVAEEADAVLQALQALQRGAVDLDAAILACSAAP